ncbi:hypothetical protein V8C34DRAFT_218347 [Trichoderma compactum]
MYTWSTRACMGCPFDSAQSAETHKQIRAPIPHCRANPAMMLRAIPTTVTTRSVAELRTASSFQEPRDNPNPQKGPKKKPSQSTLASRIATPTSSALPASRHQKDGVVASTPFLRAVAAICGAGCGKRPNFSSHKQPVRERFFLHLLFCWGRRISAASLGCYATLPYEYLGIYQAVIFLSAIILILTPCLIGPPTR